MSSKCWVHGATTHGKVVTQAYWVNGNSFQVTFEDGTTDFVGKDLAFNGAFGGYEYDEEIAVLNVLVWAKIAEKHS